MITKENFRTVLAKLEFTQDGELYSKKFNEFECELSVDFKNELLMYPEKTGFLVNERQTCNFKANENFVVFECVCRLLDQGYHPAHIELEPKWQVGHGASGGRADILVKDNDEKALLIIECKTAGNEFNKAWNTTQTKPTQLFSYVQQTKSTKFIALYASDFVDDKVVSNYYLVNLCDNEELLKNNPKLRSFKEATTVDEIYTVWSDTYAKEYASLGLFENNKPYEIGKTKFQLSDLKTITSKDIQGKYHEFATILRQHNVSGRENAFDKLVNLFLCKVVDEKANPDELKFYWKGKAYDNPFDFQDRLQQLYKNGMKEFLGEEITYVDNSAIDEAFDVFKNRPNATKEKIKEMVKELKFFTNNDFAFIDVHNQRLFEQNFDVLLKIARLIQDISLTDSDENQFLGDMFEGFLDQGVKQSEGQFFTPMPIVKFIINSLPPKQNPKVIDYACGAGHFLNEYFTTNRESHIVGIEKEYRLSKVAKVSSFMYGSDMNIIYADALSLNDKIKEESFDVLIANPPYSVKGFLETLENEDRVKYELLKSIDEKSYTANNAIECFFIERAAQLLKKGGVAGIIVPSSILNKGAKNNIYVATREILLKYFDIIAIAEFGSGTFGKTGTNTVTLFLKRRGSNPDMCKHLEYMADAWFEGDFTTNEAFKDHEILQMYCSHIGIDFELYKSLLCGNMDDALFALEMFGEYKAEFEKLTETKNRRKARVYTAKSSEEKVEIEKNELVKFIKTIEKEKLLYFGLASKNSTDVIIVKSPSDNKEIKKFLGYEWSSAKGNEGIKYLTSRHSDTHDRHTVFDTVSTDGDDLDEEDKRILENLQGLQHINTPLYNPKDFTDETKINTIIAANFARSVCGEPVEPQRPSTSSGRTDDHIPTELTPFVTRARLVDMLDFSRVEFNKAISLVSTKKADISLWDAFIKFPKEKLVHLALTNPSKSEISKLDENTVVSFVEMASVSNNGFIETKVDKPLKDLKKGSFTYFAEHDIIIAKITPSMENGKCAIASNLTNKIGMGSSEFHVIRCNEHINCKYMFILLNNNNVRRVAEQQMTGASGHRRVPINFYRNLQIPLPPLNIQQKIVDDIEYIEQNGIDFPVHDIKKYQEEIRKAKEAILKKYL